MGRSVQHAREALEFVEEVNVMVTRILNLRGNSGAIPEEEADPKVEAAAIILGANLLSVANGDWDGLINDLWPRVASGQIQKFRDNLNYALATTGGDLV